VVVDPLTIQETVVDFWNRFPLKNHFGQRVEKDQELTMLKSIRIGVSCHKQCLLINQLGQLS
jgi:hypothetical protein